MTRLIDFTSNPYVALFFSLHAEFDNDTTYRIYCLPKGITQELFSKSYSDIFEVNDGYLTLTQPDNKNSFTSVFSVAIDRLKEEKQETIYTLQPNIGNNRLLMQQGLFLFPTILEKEVIKRQLDDNSIILSIDPNLRDEALRLLDKLGYNEFRLMPDLDNVSREINRYYRNKTKA